MNNMAIMQGALIAAIFLLLFITCWQLFAAWSQTVGRRVRLRSAVAPSRMRRLWQGKRAGLRITRHIEDLLESLNMKWTTSAFLATSVIGFFIGLSAGAYLFQNLKGLLLLSIMLAASPYVWLRMRLISRQMRSRLDFLPAVEVFYQYYMMAGTRNIRQVLSGCLEERRLRLPVRISFELLFRHLSTNRSIDDALRIFAFSLGHVWGQYFTNLLRIGLTEGVDISSSLQELIRDMRQAQVADQAARNRLLEIRIANFSPPVFFVVFLIVNFQLNGEQAFYYYFVDPVGRNMLLNGLALMFASFVMGVWLSIRRM